MTFTHEQIRAAILRAADRIEREPGCYDFNGGWVPSGSCGTTACMWGWIGLELGMPVGAPNMEVSDAAGVPNTWHLYNFCRGLGDFPHHEAGTVPTALRAYANKYFPESNTIHQPVVSWSECVWKPDVVRS
jgi:hypothetical protein